MVVNGDGEEVSRVVVRRKVDVVVSRRGGLRGRRGGLGRRRLCVRRTLWVRVFSVHGVEAR